MYVNLGTLVNAQRKDMSSYQSPDQSHAPLDLTVVISDLSTSSQYIYSALH